MKLDTEFFPLPLRCNVEQLLQEVSQFSQGDWLIHSERNPGNASAILVSAGGTIQNDQIALSVSVEPTPLLERCPYFKQVMQALNLPISHSRLVKVSGATETPLKADRNYYWFRRLAIYIPILINPAVKFFCNDKSIQMTVGEAGIFNNWHPHFLVNSGEEDCIYWVIETKGSPALQTMLAQADRNSNPVVIADVPEESYQISQIPLEPYCFEVLTPTEICELTATLISDTENSQIPESELRKLVQNVEEFRKEWEKAFAQFGHHQSGELTYQNLILNFQEKIASKANKWQSPLGNGKQSIEVISSMLLTSNPADSQKVTKQLIARKKLAVKPKFQGEARYQVSENLEAQPGFSALKELSKHWQILEFFRSPATPAEVIHRLPVAWEMTAEEFASAVQRLMDLEVLKEEFICPEFERPIFILSAPRAGSTLLFETLSRFPDLWSIGMESHAVIEGISELHPSAHNFSSNRLTSADALPHIVSALRQRFAQKLKDRDECAYLDIPVKQRPKSVRFLEKTPKNALRIPFLNAVFPGALFIYIYRDPKENISSMIEGWRSRCFVSYKNLPGWPLRDWCFLLTPEWSSLQNSSVAEIAAYQWKIANSYIWDDLQALPTSSWRLVRYDELVQTPKKIITELSDFAGLQMDGQIQERLSQSLPISKVTLSAPSPDKWRKNAKEIAAVLPTLEPILSLVEK